MSELFESDSMFDALIIPGAAWALSEKWNISKKSKKCALTADVQHLIVDIPRVRKYLLIVIMALISFCNKFTDILYF